MAKKDIIIIISTFCVVSIICAGLVAGSLYLKKKTSRIIFFKLIIISLIFKISYI